MNQIPNIEDEKTGIEELDNLANIYGWHHEKCAGHSHFPSCPVVRLRRILIKEQQTLHQQLQKARHDIHTSLVAAVEGLKYQQPHVDTPFHTEDKIYAMNATLDQVLTIINSIFKE